MPFSVNDEAYRHCIPRVLVCLTALFFANCNSAPNVDSADDRVSSRSTPSSHTVLRDAQVRTESQTPPVPLTGLLLGQAGPVAIDLRAMQSTVAEARVLRQWQTGKRPELAALENQRLRQKVLIRGIETRLVRREVNHRKLATDPTVLEGLLKRAALGIAPEKRLNKKQGHPIEIGELQALIEARYEAPFSVVRRVALDLVEHRALSDDLMAKTTEDTIQKEWVNSHTCLDATLYRIPRVPTSAEIDEAVKNRATDMETYYRDNGRLFKTPARTFVKRLLLATDKDTDTKVARTRLEKLRTDILEGASKGSDLEKSMLNAIDEHGYPRDRRSGGRKTLSQKTRPDLHELPVGTVTEIEQHPLGWVFYFIEGHGTRVERTLGDRRVQREIAAAILRRDDQLTHAKQVAGQLAYKLRQTPNSADIPKLLKAGRIRSSETGTFCRTQAKSVPTIGLAPELSKILFELKSKGAVSRPVRVRQDYVVGVLKSYESKSDEDWQRARSTYQKEWRRKNAPNAVKAWLSETTSKRKIRINQPRLKALSVDQFGLETGGD